MESILKSFLYLILIIVILMAYAQAQEIEITGTISDQDRKPVVGANIILANRTNLSTTTDNAGTFRLISSIAVHHTPSRGIPFAEPISIDNGIISIILQMSAQLKIELFDLKGALLGQLVNRNTRAGIFRVNLNERPLSSSIILIRVSTGRNTEIFRFIHANGRSVPKKTHFSATSSGKMAKLQTSVDKLIVYATGYLTEEVDVSSYQTTVNVSLESMTLEPFSFFITSLSGLQELSGSENGFGGDLRFGHTGPGAGLRGADSICECLAEMSMPGAKGKVWRAFLSVKDGGSGSPVNAIDRIGNGPWYDRLGRLWANNKNELLNDRPPNADPAIRNDIPNEFGIPNHRPDPTLPEVDNHLTITGSNKLGLLYDHERDGESESLWGDFEFPSMNKQTFDLTGISKGGEYPENPTCDDWTSTTAQSSPRAGFSWPQADFGRFSGKNWLSVWSMTGCEAGIDLDPSTLSGVDSVFTIGNGGGYGGFYCFALVP